MYFKTVAVKTLTNDANLTEAAGVLMFSTISPVGLTRFGKWLVPS